MSLENYIEKHAELIRQMPDFFSVVGLDNTIMTYNDYAARAMGYRTGSKPKPIRYADMPCKASEAADVFVKQDKMVLAAESGEMFLSYYYYAEEFGWRLCICRKSSIHDEERNLLGLICTMTDLTHTRLIDVARFVTEGDSYFNSSNKGGFNYHVANQQILYDLSPREMECLFYLLRGKSNKQIAVVLDLSPRTVESYIDQVKAKMRCNTRSELIEKAIHEGMLNIIPKRFLG
jgi:DNA-binding CsgD family transcriptional regulator